MIRVTTVRLALLAALGGFLGLLSGCDRVAAYASREVQVSEEAIDGVREAVLTSPRWGAVSARTRFPGTLQDCAWRLTLHVDGDVVEVDVFIVARPIRLGLTSYVDRAAPGSIATVEARNRAHLKSVYLHLREACPALPPWSATTDRSPLQVRDEEGTSRGSTWAGLGVVTLVLLGLLGGLVARRARSRRTHGYREPRVPWPDRADHPTPGPRQDGGHAGA